MDITPTRTILKSCTNHSPPIFKQHTIDVLSQFSCVNKLFFTNVQINDFSTILCCKCFYDVTRIIIFPSKRSTTYLAIGIANNKLKVKVVNSPWLIHSNDVPLVIFPCSRSSVRAPTQLNISWSLPTRFLPKLCHTW